MGGANLNNVMVWIGRNLMSIGLVLVCLMSMAFNGYFGWIKGAVIPVIGAPVMAAGLVGCELIKYGAAYWAGEHWGRSWSRLAATILLLIGVTAISFQAQVGFIGLVSGDTAAHRSASATLAGDAAASLAQDRKELADLKALPRYQTSRACTNATAEQSVRMCERIAVLETRLATAAETVVERGDVGVGDPFVAVLLWFWPANERSMLLGVAVSIAVINEILTALGWFAAGRAAETGGGLGSSPLSFESDQSASVAKMVKLGVLTHPALKELMAWQSARLEPADGHWLTLAVAYLDYQAWCGTSANGEPLAREVFGRLFRTVVKEHPSGDGYVGWRLRPAASVQARSA